MSDSLFDLLFGGHGRTLGQSSEALGQQFQNAYYGRRRPNYKIELSKILNEDE